MAKQAGCLFVTGTDTGVGKTRVAVRLLETLKAQGVRAAGFKPILSGEDRDDADQLWRASADFDAGSLSIDEVNPIWLKIPAAPLSARLAGETAAGTIDRCRILDTFEALATRHEVVIIEGAGGWDVPLTETSSFADLAVEFDAPVLVVAANRLGVLNHTRLTVKAVQQTRLEVAAVILNEISPPDPADVARATNLEALRLTLPSLAVEGMDWEATGPFSEAVRRSLGWA